jgi:hypothetical protein
MAPTPCESVVCRLKRFGTHGLRCRDPEMGNRRPLADPTLPAAWCATSTTCAQGAALAPALHHLRRYSEAETLHAEFHVRGPQ